MVAHRAALLAALLFGSPAYAQPPAGPRDVTIPAPDGIDLKATYYPAAQPGPAVLLLHMCNATRRSWDHGENPLALWPGGQAYRRCRSGRVHTPVSV
jgi:hypothetical protein